VVVSVQPSLADDSEFSAVLKDLQQNKAPSLVAKAQPEVINYTAQLRQYLF
jgi:sulfite reductase (NADPH) hemoprotein beta-component